MWHPAGLAISALRAVCDGLLNDVPSDKLRWSGLAQMKVTQNSRTSRTPYPDAADPIVQAGKLIYDSHPINRAYRTQYTSRDYGVLDQYAKTRMQ